jgi:hypothetical protein
MKSMDTHHLIIGWILAMLLLFGFYGQVFGENMFTPTVITAGSFGKSFAYSDTKNTGGCSNVYGRSTNDVFYQFTLTQKMKVSITNCGSPISTYVYLLETSNNPTLSSYYWSGETICTSLIQRELPAGTYYVVSEGYDQNGEIQTNITGAIYGDNRSHPVVAGSFGGNSQYSDTRNTTAFTNAYNGRSTNDVFYRMTLTRKLTVTLTHCGSSIDTYMHLLDASGNLIVSNDDYSGDGACSSS